MFTPGTNFWTIAAELTQPIFQGGTLLHKQRAAEAAFEAAKAQYRSTVLWRCKTWLTHYGHCKPTPTGYEPLSHPSALLLVASKSFVANSH